MAVIAIFPTGALAGATECTGLVSGPSGALVVHFGDTCTVNGATVSGGIKMDGGTLQVCDSTISGGIQAKILPANRSSSWVIIGLGVDDGGTCDGSTISGGVNLQYVQGYGPAGSIELEGNTITGGVTLKNNGTVELEDNTITGGCHASGNTIVVNDGLTNDISGGADGQCVGL
jgi:hypothetical protein